MLAIGHLHGQETIVERMAAEARIETVRSTELRRDSEGVVRHGSEWLLLWADPDSIRSAEARARAMEVARRTARAERAVAAALRAMAGQDGLGVRFGPGDAALEQGGAVLPAIGQPPTEAGIAVARGAADRLAAWLRHHNPALPPANAMLAMLEQARCEALTIRRLPGVADNLARYAAWHLDRAGFGHARLPGDLPLGEAMAVVLRGVLTGTALALDATALQVWDRWVRIRLANETSALLAALDDQAAYAGAAARFIAALYRSIGRADDALAAPPPPPDGDAGDGSHAPRRMVQSDSAETDAAAAPLPPKPAPPANLPYHAFTTAHDRVLRPDDLCGAAELAALRARLDGETGGTRALLARLAAQLQRRLLAQQRRDWDFDRDDGVLDTARLDRVVTRPGAALAFKQEREAAFRDTVVCLLIDCSGSMRGRSIMLAAIAADITARALERGGVACEVLGFTTADFNGGRSAQDWARAGRPPQPGRLGDLRHIVLKSADTSWRAARAGFGVLLKPELLRENVDGEALAWAHRRMLARRERRRVLVVISDGAPAEAATLRANPPGLLEFHLHAAIAAIAQSRQVELRAIGIRHDVAQHYPHSVTIGDAQMVGPALMAHLASVFTPARRTARHAN